MFEDRYTNNKKLAYGIVNKFISKDNVYLRKEFESIALISLWKASETFNEDLGFAFSTYATKLITNDILMFLRSNKKFPTKSLNEIVFDDENKEIELQEMISNGESSIEHLVEVKDIFYFLEKKLVTVLKQKELEVYKLLRQNKTVEEMSKILFVSKSIVKRRMIKVRRSAEIIYTQNNN